MTEPSFTFLPAAPPANIPADAIVSQTSANNDAFKATLFSFAKDQELTEHATPRDAMLFFLHGEFEVITGGEQFTATPGAWLHLPPSLPHSLRALSPGQFLLIILK
ncbi:MAG: cupin domain-containing protein [Anaerolineae bacterium]|nr:MAG: cupin domain-containing protein [Anaerolineae bacterium]